MARKYVRFGRARVVGKRSVAYLPWRDQLRELARLIYRGKEIRSVRMVVGEMART